ncbi:ABC transporter permease [Caproiciproducens sp.]|uniref:ABC transporter permease n=1 Tax=Caproiciproducens sp. TaxID=1954376 RepID=UPI00289BDDDA|nr:ABC transporter permease [Caproiciproducens sp.]
MKKQNLILSEYDKQEIRKKQIYKALPIVSVILLIAIWLLASSSGNSQFPSPAATWHRLLVLLHKPIKNLSLWGHILASLERVVTALVLSWILGISFGILLGWSKKCNALFGPVFTAFRAVPPLAWIPLFTIWFGTSEGSKILLVFIGAVMPVVVNTQAGMSNVNKLYLDVGTIFNASSRQKLFQIAIPSALDAIFAGVRTSASAGWMVVLAAEMLGANSGVGFLITRGMDSGDLPLVLLAMICIGIIGAILAIFTQIAEGVICPWTRKRSN